MDCSATSRPSAARSCPARDGACFWTRPRSAGCCPRPRRRWPRSARARTRRASRSPMPPRCARAPAPSPISGRLRWRAEEFDVRRGDRRAGARHGRSRRAAQLRHPRAWGACQRAGAPRRRAASLGRAPPRRPAARSRQARPSRGGRHPGGARSRRDAGEGGAGRGRHPGSARRARRAGLHAAIRDRARGRACGGTGCFCYDLDLPAEFAPAPHDNEVAGFELWPFARGDAPRRGDRRLQVQRQPRADRPLPAEGAGRSGERDAAPAPARRARRRRQPVQPSGGAVAIGISRASAPGCSPVPGASPSSFAPIALSPGRRWPFG